MDSSLTTQKATEPIVALACKDRAGNFHIVRCDQPLTLNEIERRSNMIQMKEMCFPYKWYDSIILCTEENLQELKHAL